MAAVEVVHERVLAHPLDTCYAWLTDYEDHDAARAGAVIEEREVVGEDEEADRVELAERVSALGFQRQVRTLVDRDPPDRWEARVYESHGHAPDVFTYELEPADEESTRLRATYRFADLGRLEWLLLRVLSPLIRRRIDSMWTGFEQAMDRELTTHHV